MRESTNSRPSFQAAVFVHISSSLRWPALRDLGTYQTVFSSPGLSWLRSVLSWYLLFSADNCLSCTVYLGGGVKGGKKGQPTNPPPRTLNKNSLKKLSSFKIKYSTTISFFQLFIEFSNKSQMEKVYSLKKVLKCRVIFHSASVKFLISRAYWRVDQP